MNASTTYISLSEIVEHNTGPTAHNFDYQVAILDWITAQLNALPNMLMLECEMSVVALTSGTLRPAIEVHVSQSVLAALLNGNGASSPASYMKSFLLEAARKIMRETTAAEFAAHVLACAANCTQLRINALRRQIRDNTESLEALRGHRIALDREECNT